MARRKSTSWKWQAPVTRTVGSDLISRSYSLAVAYALEAPPKTLKVPCGNALQLWKRSLHLLHYRVGRRLC